MKTCKGCGRPVGEEELYCLECENKDKTEDDVLQEKDVEESREEIEKAEEEPTEEVEEPTSQLFVESAVYMKEDKKEKFLSAIKEWNVEEISRIVSSGEVDTSDPGLMYEALKRGGGKAYRFFSESVTPDLMGLMMVEAVLDNNLKAAKVFLSEGADVNIKNRMGWTALHEASKEGSLEIAKFLIEKGADVNMTNEKGLSALHRASNYGHLDIVQLLIENDADVNCKDTEDMTPLVFAQDRGYLDVARLLIEKGADVNCMNRQGKVPLLFEALQKDYVENARLMIEKGAEPNTGDEKEPVLLFALKKGYLEIVQLLIGRGANPNAKDENGITPLILAFKKGLLDIARLFIEKGADVNVKDENGMTPLHFAANLKDKALVELIVKRGANVVAWDSEGFLPLHESGDKKISSFLRRKMFPAKIMYSIRILFVVILLSSVVLPFMSALAVAASAFFVSLLFTAWPSRSAYRLYFLELMAIYFLIMNLTGVRFEGLESPWHYMVVPLALFLVFNFAIRPAILFFIPGEDSVSERSVGSFFKQYITEGVSFSPITLLRKKNILVVFVIVLAAIFSDFEYLRKNDQYLLASIVRAMAQWERRPAPSKRTPYVMTPLPTVEELYVSGNKDFDLAIKQYLAKNFDAAIRSLDRAAKDPSLSEKANEVKLEIQRFRRLWERAQQPAHEQQALGRRREAIINRMIQYDRNISGGRLGSEIIFLKHDPSSKDES